MTLIDRLSKLEGPDREVDAAIWMHLIEKPGINDKIDRDMVGRYPSYTASIDAAIALAEIVLPGWKWRVGRTELFPNGWAYVHKYDPSNCDRTDEAACADGKAATPAIALLIALLRAKEASHGQ